MDRSPSLKTIFIPLLLASILVPRPCLCLPEPEEVVSGKVEFKYPDSNTLQIDAEDKAIVNYKSFDIKEHESVIVNLPFRDNEILNRVTGNSVSQILGKLTSNGVFILINQNGIIFGPKADVDAASLIASTKDITNSDFLSSNYVFGKLSDERINNLILNQGSINIREGGFGVLIADAIENQGTIIASIGTIALAAGDLVRLEISKDNLISIAIDKPTASKIYDLNGNPITDQIKNSGAISNDGGVILLKAEALSDIFEKAINLEGFIRADKIENHSGILKLVSSGNIEIKGEIASTEVIIGKEDEAVPSSVEGTLTAKESVTVTADRLSITSRALLTDIHKKGDINITSSKSEEGAITLEGDGIRLTYLKENNLALEADNSITVTPLAAIQANQVKLTARKFGTADLPLKIEANTTHINRSQGSLDIAQSQGLGTNILLRGPPDGFGAITYHRDTRLILEASQVTLSGAEPIDLYGNITFFNFTSIIPNKGVYFEEGRTYTFKGDVHIKGAPGYDGLIKLASSKDGLPWYSDFSQAKSVHISYVAIKDAHNLGNSIQAKPAANLGNSLNWQTNLTWLGQTEGLLWSEAENWDTFTLPTEYDTVILNNDKDSIIDTSFSSAVKDLILDYSYTGSLILQNNLKAANDIYFKGGQILFNSYDISVSGFWHLVIKEADLKGLSPVFERGFKSMEFELVSKERLFQDRIPQGTITALSKSIIVTYPLKDGITLKNLYEESKIRALDNKVIPIKQTITFDNPTDKTFDITFISRAGLDTEAVIWDGREYKITPQPQYFSSYQKTASVMEFAKDIGSQDLEGLDYFSELYHTYTMGTKISYLNPQGELAVFDFSDVANLNHEVALFSQDAKTTLELKLTGLNIPARDTLIIDPNYALTDATSYNIRYDGIEGDSRYANFIAIGDVNGDGLRDLALAGYLLDTNGGDSGAVYVIFSTLVDNVGTTTGNNQPLSTAANYNIRYAGGAVSEQFGTAIAIGDVNGDNLGDLVFGGNGGGYNGADSGSVYVVFSTLVDNVGTTTGNNQPLSTAANYNIRYDGAAADDRLGEFISIGDVNGDSLGDLVLQTERADNNGANSGSVWVMFSTLIDNVGATTGNNQPLSTAANYNIRYDGGAAGDLLTNVMGKGIALGDVNGDSLGDLVLGAQEASASLGYTYVMFSTLIDNVGATTGNNQPLSTAANYNIRYEGAVALDRLGRFISIGDLNGDGLRDLVVATPVADNNGATSGSAWVMFSTLIDNVGATTGNNQPFSAAGNYNIRYDGGAAGDALGTAIAIGDVNGDSLGDLVLGAPLADNNGASSGSVWVMFSTLIDNIGATTDNNQPLSTAGNYNIRYDGGAAGEELGGPTPPFLGDAVMTLGIGDVSGDSLGDLVLGAGPADNNGANSGSVYVVFSTLIDDVGTTTGNNQPFSVAANYSNRYDGAAGDQLSNPVEAWNVTLAIGDVNGDSSGDLVLEARFADNNGDNTGSVWVMFSTPVTPATPATTTTTTTTTISPSDIEDATKATDIPASPVDTGGLAEIELQTNSPVNISVGGEKSASVEYGFDFSITYEREEKYKKYYLKGKYRTIVIVLEGKVVSSPYDDKGPQYQQSNTLTTGQKISSELEIK